LHPLWDEYELPELSFYLSSFSLAASLSFPQANGSARGGVLADEMGMVCNYFRLGKIFSLFWSKKYVNLKKKLFRNNFLG